MARDLDRLEQLTFAQLVDLGQDRALGRFPANGSFVQAKRNDIAHWYFQGYEKPSDGSPRGRRTRVYVGPVGEEAAETARNDHEIRHRRYRDRRRIAAQLRRIGLPSPPLFDGAVLEALSSAGVFDAGAILVGSAAYQTFPGLVGARLDQALMQTGDLDIARARGIAAPPGQVGDLEKALRQVDPTFRPILDRNRPNLYSGYVNDRLYKIEFLTSGARRAETATSMVELKGLNGLSAQPIQFLEYLLEDSVRSVALHDDGVPVVVPDPARYAVHKLIVARMRERISESRGAVLSARGKIAKDVAQASSLIRAMTRLHQQAAIGMAWADAWRRGPRWRDHLLLGSSKLDPSSKQVLEDAVLSTAGPDAWTASKRS